MCARRASVLAVTVEPRHALPFFVLGVGEPRVGWEPSDRLADFGGCLRHGESPAHAAAREFFEETLGVISPWRGGAVGLARVLEREHVLAVLEDARRVCYVVEIPWDPEIPRRFAHVRALLGGLDAACRGAPLTPAQQDALLPACRATRRRRHRWLLDHPAVVRCHRARGVRGKPCVRGVREGYLDIAKIVLCSFPQALAASARGLVRRDHVDVLSAVADLLTQQHSRNRFLSS